MPPVATDSAASDGNRKLTKNEKRRLRQKEEKAKASVALPAKGKDDKVKGNKAGGNNNKKGKQDDDEDLGDVEIEYVSAEYSSTVMDEFQGCF